MNPMNRKTALRALAERGGTANDRYMEKKTGQRVTYALMCALISDGLVTHRGLGHYVLTDKGRRAAEQT